MRLLSDSQSSIGQLGVVTSLVYEKYNKKWLSVCLFGVVISLSRIICSCLSTNTQKFRVVLSCDIWLWKLSAPLKRFGWAYKISYYILLTSAVKFIAGCLFIVKFSSLIGRVSWRRKKTVCIISGVMWPCSP